MELLTTRWGCEAFWQRLSTAMVRVLLLDYDGTLAPFRQARDKATPYPGVRQVLGAIVDCPRSRTAVISGRSIGDLEPLLGLPATVELWGTHGWEWRDAKGRYEVAPLPPQIHQALDGLTECLGANGFAGQWERKPASVAVHWRGLDPDQHQAIREAAQRYWETWPQKEALALKPFDGGLELYALGRDKGTTVRSILAELEPDACVAYLGDDLTDEDAFAALDERGLAVLVRPEWRETRADWWLQPPGEILRFLTRWQRTLGAP